MRRSVLATVAGLSLAVTVGACSSAPTSTTSTPVPTQAPPARTQPVSPCPGAVNWSQADRYTGKTVTVEGPVKSVRYEPSSTGQPTFLNVGKDYPNSDRIAVVIWGENRSKFAPKPENAYSNQTVCITASVGTYRGVTQMTVTKPNQIKVL